MREGPAPGRLRPVDGPWAANVHPSGTVHLCRKNPSSPRFSWKSWPPDGQRPSGPTVGTGGHLL